MQNRLGLCYTTILINCHSQPHGENAVSKSTVNVAFKILQPKITKIKKIQQGKNNEGQWKALRYQKVKQWLFMLNRLPEEKE